MWGGMADADSLERVSENEKDYEKLWQIFFSSISVRERENPKCQRNHLPFRFRPEMTEFAEEK